MIHSRLVHLTRAALVGALVLGAVDPAAASAETLPAWEPEYLALVGGLLGLAAAAIRPRPRI